MGMSGLQKQSNKPSSEKALKSFEEVLGKTNPSPTTPQKKIESVEKVEARDAKPYAKPGKPDARDSKTDAREQKPALRDPKAGSDQSASRENSRDPEGQKNAEAQSLPVQPNGPALNGPTVNGAAPINDRLVNSKAVGEPSLIDTGVPTEGEAVQNLSSQEDGVDSLTRRVVWNDFLRKMKDDLDVSAEDVLSAFAELSDEELAQPPQETINAVVTALGLNAEQSQTAKNYLSDLIAKTKSNSMGEELGKSQKQINLTLMSQREAQRKTINRGVDQLQQNFFMKNPQASAGMMTQAQVAALSAKGEAAAAMGRPAGRDMEMTTIAAPASEIPGMNVSAPPTNFPQVPGEKAEPKNTIDEMVRAFLSPQTKTGTLKAGEMSAAPVAAAVAGGASAVGADTAMQAAAAGSLSAGSVKGLLEDLTSGKDSEEDGEYSSDASFLGAGLAGEAKNQNVAAPSAEFQAEMTKMAKEPISVPDLVDKAQIMVHEGGGEMKVTLTPDGMGEVAMKVSVHEGKVQVQMITESDEAKKLIERQLGELKSSLHANDLKLDTIKIDTASNLGKQLEQQYQDAQRQQTQTAWEQFRQDNQGWRRSQFETPSAKLYKGQGDAPRDLQAPNVTAQRKNINRRLDLVA